MFEKMEKRAHGSKILFRWATQKVLGLYASSDLFNLFCFEIMDKNKRHYFLPFCRKTWRVSPKLT